MTGIAEVVSFCCAQEQNKERKKCSPAHGQKLGALNKAYKNACNEKSSGRQFQNPTLHSAEHRKLRAWKNSKSRTDNPEK